MKVIACAVCVASLVLLALSCGGTSLYDPCTQAAECEPPDGYVASCVGSPGICTWNCSVDTDCSGPGEDPSLVCSNSAGTTAKNCFPGCAGGAACPAGLTCQVSTTTGVDRNVCLP